MKQITYFLVLILLASCNHQDAHNDKHDFRQGDLGNGYFLNPILGGDFPDPTIVRDGKDFYMTHSSFDYVPGLIVYHSTDLVNWEPISFALKKYLGSVWAPDITKHGNRYYIYFTVAHPSGRMNFVTCADSPCGPWSDPVDLKVGNIDPGHAVGEDGSRWIFLSGGKRARLNDDGLSIVPGSLEQVYTGWAYPSDWVTEGMCLEGPKIRKIGDYYYYLNAEGGTAGPPTSHMVVVARSKSINGPWENSPYNPLIHTWDRSERWWSKGHGSLIDTPEGGWWIVYHAYENNFTSLGRQTLLEPVELTTDGWLKAPSGKAIEQAIKKPVSSHNRIDRRAKLGEFRVGLDWKFYKDFDSTRFYVNNKELVLDAKGDSPGTSSPLMCIAGERAYEIEVEIEKDENTTAGLVLYYNSSFYAGIGFDQQRTIRYRQGIRRNASNHNGGNHLWLRLKNDNQVLTGAYSYDGIHWTQESWGMEISGYNHNTLYEFQSMLPALFASGQGKVRFKNFKYTSL